jgi:fatty-acid desaturase
MNFEQIQEYCPENWDVTSHPQWEIRDVLSNNWRRELPISEKELELIEQILVACDKGTDISWNQEDLSLFAEAQIQMKLLDFGFELRCYGLNVFPTSTSKLTEHLVELDIRRDKMWQLKRKWGSALNYIYKWKDVLTHASALRTYQIVAILLFALFVDPILVPLAFLAGWVISNCTTIIIHEYWVHDLISPRHRVLDFVLNWWGHLMYDVDRIDWRYVHSYHHRSWKTPLDKDNYMGVIPNWQLFFFGRSLDEACDAQFDHEEFHKYRASYTAKEFAKLPPETQFLEKHRTKIKWLSHLVFALMLGFTNWLVFIYLQALFFQKYILLFNELITHNNTLPREEEQDSPHLFWACCGTAYHVVHHFDRDQIVVGPGKLKYLNIQYYFLRMLFKKNPGIHFS